MASDGKMPAVRSGSCTTRRVIHVPDPLLCPINVSLLEPEPDDYDGGLNDRIDTPPTPLLVLRPGATQSPSTPDTETNVAHQTSALFGSFVAEMNGRRQQMMSDVSSSCLGSSDDVTGEVDQPAYASVYAGRSVPTDDDHGLMSSVLASNGLVPLSTASGATAAVPDELLTTEMRVARQLAIIADDVDARYSSEFNKMVRQLRVDQNTAYGAFATVARQLFGDGVINWGRIIVLLCFGYRVVVAAVRGGCRHLFAKFFSFVVQFIIHEKIARWIAAQGGWVTALRYIPESMSVRTVGVIVGVAAVCVAAAIFLSKN